MGRVRCQPFGAVQAITPALLAHLATGAWTLRSIRDGSSGLITPPASKLGSKAICFFLLHGIAGYGLAQAFGEIARETLRGADYPASRDDLVQLAREQDADTVVIAALLEIPDEEYDSPDAVVVELVAV